MVVFSPTQLSQLLLVPMQAINFQHMDVIVKELFLQENSVPADQKRQPVHPVVASVKFFSFIFLILFSPEIFLHLFLGGTH